MPDYSCTCLTGRRREEAKPAVPGDFGGDTLTQTSEAKIVVLAIEKGQRIGMRVSVDEARSNHKTGRIEYVPRCPYPRWADGNDDVIRNMNVSFD